MGFAVRQIGARIWILYVTGSITLNKFLAVFDHQLLPVSNGKITTWQNCEYILGFQSMLFLSTFAPIRGITEFGRAKINRTFFTVSQPDERSGDLRR